MDYNNKYIVELSKVLYLVSNQWYCLQKGKLPLGDIHNYRRNTLVPQVSKFEDESIRGMKKILFSSIKILEYRYKYKKISLSSAFCMDT